MNLLHIPTVKPTLPIWDVPSFHNYIWVCAYHARAFFQTGGEEEWTTAIKSLPSYLYWEKTDNE